VRFAWWTTAFPALVKAHSEAKSAHEVFMSSICLFDDMSRRIELSDDGLETLRDARFVGSKRLLSEADTMQAAEMARLEKLGLATDGENPAISEAWLVCSGWLVVEGHPGFGVVHIVVAGVAMIAVLRAHRT
jgi:hypothetical protein